MVLSKCNASTKVKKMANKLTREQKAKQLFDDGVRPIRTADGFMVLGSKGEFYDIEKLADGTFNCGCPDGYFRAHQGESCKHVLLVLMCQEFDQAASCDQCERASNLNAPHVWCARDHAHYEHDRPVCGSFDVATGREA